MSNAVTNPLLEAHELPPFPAIKPEHIVPAIAAIIADNRQALDSQLAQLNRADWQSLVQPLEAREDRLSQAWSPVGHLNGVMNSAELREAYTKAIELLTEYSTEVSQNSALFQAYQQLADSNDYQQLSTAQRKVVDNALRDFRLAGVDLAPDKKQRYAAIQQRLSQLSTQFSNNVLDATQGWYLQFDNADPLTGLPESALAIARQAATQRQLEGLVVTLDAPSYIAVMTYAHDAALREQMYRAYVSRASALGVAVGDKNPSDWDNTALIAEILRLKHEFAQLLGFNNYAERSLATKMASSTDEVINFLQQLVSASRPAAQRELDELLAFAKQQFNVDTLNAWDIAYYSEKLRQHRYAISDEELRPYFPADKVVSGLFEVVSRLFDVAITVDLSVATWHKDAKFYRIKRQGQVIAGFYLDIFARDNKRGGAWMDECRVRRKTDTVLQLPVAYLTCNFSPPTSEQPSLLTHTEVTTLFHEFGHGIHHMLTAIDCAAVSGINGVAWDAVELPSQFFENWCWQAGVIPLISAHYQTGEPLPQALLDKMLAAKNFQSAMQMVRQLEFALFDFRLHREYQPDNPQDPQILLDEVRRQVAVIIPPEFNKFQNSFSHIFAGGYAAGYYSYKWAEVLSSDAFSLFEENGIFDHATAVSFLENILQRGGSEDAMELFVRFRGRPPKVDALLRHSGIETDAKQ